jgi:hypothetical protein
MKRLEVDVEITEQSGSEGYVIRNHRCFPSSSISIPSCIYPLLV